MTTFLVLNLIYSLNRFALAYSWINCSSHIQFKKHSHFSNFLNNWNLSDADESSNPREAELAAWHSSMIYSDAYSITLRTWAL